MTNWRDHAFALLYWRHYHRDVEFFDTLEAAASWRNHQEDAGDISAEAIYQASHLGWERVGGSEADEAARRVAEREDAWFNEQPKRPWVLEVTGPEGVTDDYFDAFTTEAEANAAAASLPAFMNPIVRHLT